MSLKKSVEVLIFADAKQATAEIDRLAGNVSANADTMGSKFAAFGKKVALVTGAAGLAVAGLSVKMAIDFENSHARFVTALKASGQSFAQWQPQVNKAQQSLENMGFTNSDVQNSLSRLVPATKNAKQATSDLAIAANIAAKQHISLETATGLLVKTEGGRYVGLTRTLGVSKEVIASFHSTADAVDYLRTHFAGQGAAAADTFGGKIQVLKAKLTDLGVKIGQALIPIIEALVNAIQSAIAWFEKHRTIAIALGVVIGTVLVAAMATWVAGVVAGAATAVASMAVAAAGFVFNGAIMVAAMLPVTAPVLAIVAAIGVLVAAGYFLYTNWDAVWNFIANNPWMRVAEDILLFGLPEAIRGVSAIINAIDWGAVWGAIGDALSFVYNNVIAPVLGAIQDAIGAIADAIGAVKSAAGSVTSPTGPDFHITKGKGGKVAIHGSGGIFSTPHLGLVAESGPEAIIPLSNPGRAASIMSAAGLGGGGDVYLDGAKVGRVLRKQQLANNRAGQRVS